MIKSLEALRYERYYKLYHELAEISKEIEVYYDIDKIKPWGVFVYTKDDFGDNVFDILEDEIIFYVEKHVIPEEIMPTIKKIQDKLKEIRLTKEIK
jgi:hypothetical protein